MLGNVRLAARCPGLSQVRAHGPLRVPRRPRQVPVAATGDDGTKPSEKKGQDKVAKLEETLKKAGLTKEQARRILSQWEKAGATDPDALRGFFLKGTLAPLGGLLLQTFFDAGAGGMGLVAGQSVAAASDGSWFSILGLFITYAVALYFVLQAVVDLFLVGSFATSAIAFAANTETYLDVVRSLAGKETGVGLLDRAKLAQESAKLAEVLKSIADVLREKELTASMQDTLSNLSAFMIIDEAQEKFGFRASDYGMTPEEGARVAKWFARFDENANQRIEPRELMRLAKEMGQPLTEEEAATALKLLDKNGNGVIEFNEFVEWWAGERKKTTADG